jgi:adenylate cyclase, class 2
MAKEIELRVLDVNPEEIKQRLQALGAHVIREEVQRRFVYDVEPGNQNKWIRLRDNGETIQLGVKEIVDADAIDGMEEVEVTVDSFEHANELLGMLGISPRSYQENHRSMFDLEGVEISIDQWPKLKPFIEIEAASKDMVIDALTKLGYTEADTSLKHPVDMYAEIGIDIKTVPELRFEKA